LITVNEITINWTAPSLGDKQEKTIPAMEEKYKVAANSLNKKTDLIIAMISNYSKLQKEILDTVDSIRKCLNRLSEIALRPNPLS
jgi:hypothetical protein